MFMFFFFQAEDGIRDVAVTGVQTCALPIYGAAPVLWLVRSPERALGHRGLPPLRAHGGARFALPRRRARTNRTRRSTRLNSSHGYISYAVFCLKKKKKNKYS